MSKIYLVHDCKAMLEDQYLSWLIYVTEECLKAARYGESCYISKILQ